jgi:hypothetical protein
MSPGPRLLDLAMLEVCPENLKNGFPIAAQPLGVLGYFFTHIFHGPLPGLATISP